MRVIFGAAYNYRMRFIYLQQRRQICVHLFSDIVVLKKWNAVFRGKNDMDVNTCQGLWHVYVSLSGNMLMVWHLFSQGGASLTLGYFMLPFQGNAPPTQEQRANNYGVRAQRNPRWPLLLPAGSRPLRDAARK